MLLEVRRGLAELVGCFDMNPIALKGSNAVRLATVHADMTDLISLVETLDIYCKFSTTFFQTILVKSSFKFVKIK
jgi:hypothetical protein